MTESRGHFTPNPKDYDFPMSATFRAWTYQYCEVPDPGYVPPQPDVADLEDRIGNLEAISAEPRQIPRRYEDRLEQIQGTVNYLYKKLNEIPAKKIEMPIKKKTPSKAQYGGLKVERA